MNRPLIVVITAAVFLLGACSTEPECVDTEGFERGRDGIEPPPLCHESAYAEAWQLGQALGELGRERDALKEREDDLDAVERARLRVLERDIPELQTLARIQGYMSPARIEEPPVE
jgi:hypothetical protein